MKQNAQGALEYLLLIGGAVLVAGIVIVLILGVSSSGQSGTKSSLDTLNEAKTAAGADTSMAIDASFERSSSQSITNNPGQPWYGNGGNWAIVSNNCYNGKNCLQLTGNSCDGVYQYIPISPDTTYYASAYAKGNCVLHGHLLTSAGAYGLNIGNFAGNPANPSNWQKIWATIRVNSAANTITITNSNGTSTQNPSAGTASQISQIRLYLLNCGYPVTGNDYCDMVTFRQN